MTEPRIVAETASWALLCKPHGMPSAPLREDEEGTLLSWLLSVRPEAVSVEGRKRIERGLIHRLDTGTAGIVLAAKSQAAYESLQESQEAGLIVKSYEAVCPRVEVEGPAFREAVRPLTLPRVVSSRFRPFGPKGREVRVSLPGDSRYSESAKVYVTTIHEAVPVRLDGGEFKLFRCSLTLGFRHQIRVHLACIGYPIVGDQLYNPVRSGGPLRLTAVGISFPDPDSGTTVSFSLPRRDRTIP